MTDIRYYILAAGGILAWLGIGLITTNVLHLSGTAEVAARMVIMALLAALVAGGAWLWGKRKRKAVAGAAGAEVPAELQGLFQEIDLAVRDAEARLAQSKAAAGAKLGSFPIILLAGETGSAKTSVLIQSGLEPELLAGQVYQDSYVVATRAVNIWLAKGVIVAEAGGPVLQHPALWAYFVRKLTPPALKSPFARKAAPPRAAVICCDAERFLQPGAQESLSASAMSTQRRLGEAAHLLGCSFPVYVVFTRLDRLQGFTEFVGNLTDQEVLQVLGATLAGRAGSVEGVYAEQQSRLVTVAFSDLCSRLCDKRLPFLERENDPAKLPPAYEFPRELRKLQRMLVQYLVDLGRPSQLRANPFLRGFYFSGVRPILIRENAPAVRASTPRANATSALDADTLFSGRADAPAPEPAIQSSVRSRRVPQWLFLGHLFEKVILGDRAGQSASTTSAKAETRERALLAAAASLALLWSAGLTVSYFNNRLLEQTALNAARGIAESEAGGAAQDLPSRAALERLDTLRQSAELLSRYNREGAPFSLRWGLYVGNDIYPTVRSLYFRRFHQLLFGATQVSLLDYLRKLPAKPGPTDEYKPAYDTLKAYLITTSHPDKSTRVFLSPFLLNAWAAGRQVDGDRKTLAQSQFDFYSDELKLGNPFSRDNDGEAVERARFYLSQFNAVERMYQFMLAEAGRQNPAVNFNRQFPGSAAYVTNNRDIPGAFTVKGWEFMNKAFRNLPQFFGGERWVLGERNYEQVDLAKLEPELRARYQNEYIANWREYFKASHVVPFGSVGDAANKLNQLSGNQSYLLALFCVASVNTSLPSEEAKAPYQPVQYVEPPPCFEKYVQQVNGPYVGALAGLQAAMDRVAKSGDFKEDLANATLNEATNSYRVTRQIAQSFRIDRDGNVHGMVQALMEEPIKYAEGVLGRLGPAQLNGEGKKLCGDFGALSKKYPFNTSSNVDAGLDEIDAIFRPVDGKLALFYETSLKKYVDRVGTQYVRKSDERVKVTDGFLRFFNRAMAFSAALYKNGRDPRLVYAMRAMPAEGLRGVTLSLDGQQLKGGANGSDWKEFAWPGNATRGARLSGNLGGGDLGFIQYDGLWAAFRFFGDADRFEMAGSTYSLQWVPRQGQSSQPIRLDSGKTLTLPFMLDLKGAPPVFQKGYLAGMGCVAEVAR